MVRPRSVSRIEVIRMTQSKSFRINDLRLTGRVETLLLLGGELCPWMAVIMDIEKNRSISICR